jgi:alkylation response protein AidB-like acyl-CoA dehydrogenase
VTATAIGRGTGAGAAQASAELRELAGQLDMSGDPDGRGVGLLRRHGLMSYLVPARLGGSGGTPAGMVDIAEQLGAACLGTAIIWVMHCQMVAVADQYAAEPLRSRILADVAAGQQLLASVTTEAGKGGHIMSAQASIDSAGGRLRLAREAPVVSGGRYADAFLVTMRRSADTAPDDVILVFFRPGQADCRVNGSLDMLGMRATGNVAMTFEADLPADHVIDPPGGFARLAARTMVPLGHLGWAAAWVGAAREALRQVVSRLRGHDPDGRIRRTDLALYHVATARRELDSAEAMVISALAEYTAREQAGGLDAPSFQVLINNVKLVASELAFSVANRMVDVAGMRLGYVRDGGRSGPSLELILRDLRAASLMYANDRLTQANAKLALLDSAARSFPLAGFSDAR